MVQQLINKTMDKENRVPVDNLFKDKEKPIRERELFGFAKKAFGAVKSGINAVGNLLGIGRKSKFSQKELQYIMGEDMEIDADPIRPKGNNR